MSYIYIGVFIHQRSRGENNRDVLLVQALRE